MDLFELKKEQLKLAPKVELRDQFTSISSITAIGGAACVSIKDTVIAAVVVCSFPDFQILEAKTYLLPDALPYLSGYTAYREMPALREAYNLLEQEPDILFVQGEGIFHPRRVGLASHLGLILNRSTIGISETMVSGAQVEQGNIFLGNELVGFQVITRKHANPLFISPGHFISLGSTLRITKESLHYPHKMPEPLHLAHKIARKRLRELQEKEKIASPFSQIPSVILQQSEALPS